jgi:hypothetical protein
MYHSLLVALPLLLLLLLRLWYTALRPGYCRVSMLSGCPSAAPWVVAQHTNSFSKSADGFALQCLGFEH